MKKSAKILVIAALFVSAIVMTSCSGLLSMFGSKPSGTYAYEESYNYGTLSAGYKIKINFSGSKFDMSAESWGAGSTPIKPIYGKVKVKGDG